ncbi:MAG TPA: hypothetical protein VF355_01750, partial [Anaerolineaceae bacterium]
KSRRMPLGRINIFRDLQYPICPLTDRIALISPSPCHPNPQNFVKLLKGTPAARNLVFDS